MNVSVTIRKYEGGINTKHIQKYVEADSTNDALNEALRMPGMKVEGIRDGVTIEADERVGAEIRSPIDGTLEYEVIAEVRPSEAAV